MTGWRVERSEDGEAVLTFGGLPFGQGFDLVACFGGEAPNAYAALADALARDAKVAEIVAESCVDDEAYDDVPVSYRFADCFDDVAALYPETGK